MGMVCYRQSRYADAARYFEAHCTSSSASDTVLYYLYNCYTQINAQDRAVRTLGRLVDRGRATPDIVQILFTYYRSHGRYNDLYELLTAPALSSSLALYERIPLTRRLYAEILFGASAASSAASDPLVYAITENLIPACPNGDVYPDDTLTCGNLIILLDRLVEPLYPAKFLNMYYLPHTSYIYLPYMRLVDLGVVDYEPELKPGDPASVMFAVSCVQHMKQKGLID